MGSQARTPDTLLGPSEPSTSPSVPPVAPGSTVERYQVLEPLGEGGMGSVFAAYDPGLNRRVALKFLHARYARSVSTEWRARLVREAQSMARLSHPNVVTVFDVGVADDRLFIAMELVEGGSLRKWLGEKRRGWREVLAVFLDAGDGLAAAHRAGVVHRDFKPDNVLLGADGRARVTDFGLARASDVPDTEPSFHGMTSLPPLSPESSGSLTVAGVFLGTPGYMATEQYDGAAIDARTDVFAFCASLWEALYGELPFRSKDPRKLAEVVRAGKPREPPSDRGVPKWLRRAIQKGLAPEPNDRYPGMPALVAALRADPAARRRRTFAAVAVLLCGAGVAWGVHARAQARLRACAAEGEAIDDVWSDAARGAISRAFASTGRPYAGVAASSVGQTFDAYAASWRASAEDACLATRVRKDLPEGVYELRRACLDERREELRALVDVVVVADGSVVERAPRAARALSPVVDCDQIDRLSASIRPPPDPAVRAEVRATQRALYDAKELLEAGKPAKALAGLRAIGARAEATGYGPLRAAWTYWVGLSEVQENERAAIADLERAYGLADEHRLDELRARSAMALGKLEGNWAGHTDEGHRWLRLAERTIARLGDPPLLAVTRDIDEGWAYHYEDRWREAGPLFRRALARLDAASIRDPELRAQARSGLASVLRGEGKTADAVDAEAAALGEMEAAYGDAHPLLAGYLNNLADAQLSAGAAADALATLERVFALGAGRIARGEISDHALVFGWPNQTMGEALLRLDRAADAIVRLERARAIYRTAHGEPNPDEAQVDQELAEAYRRVGRASDAAAALGEAESIGEAQKIPDGVRAGVLVGRARLALDRGDARAAIAPATEAMRLREADAPPEDLAVARLVTARALASTDRPRARDLAEQADRVFAQTRDVAGAREAASLLTALRDVGRDR